MLAVIADGMGGLQQGEAAARTAVKSFLETFSASDTTLSASQALFIALEEANRAVFSLGRNLELQGQVGTTLVAAWLEDSRLDWVCVGDSALFLFREKRMIRVNRFHTHAEDLIQKVRSGELSQMEALQDPKAEWLTSCLGKEMPSQIDRSRRPFSLQESDRLLLVTDGLYRALSHGEIQKTLNGGKRNPAQSVVAEALSRNLPDQDNLTVLVLEVGDGKPGKMASSGAQGRKYQSAKGEKTIGKSATARSWSPTLITVVAILTAATAASLVFYWFWPPATLTPQTPPVRQQQLKYNLPGVDLPPSGQPDLESDSRPVRPFPDEPASNRSNPPLNENPSGDPSKVSPESESSRTPNQSPEESVEPPYQKSGGRR